jgi:hypothetical protein
MAWLLLSLMTSTVLAQPNMATTPFTLFTLVGNSADSPALFLRLSPATGHAAEILDV